MYSSTWRSLLVIDDIMVKQEILLNAIFNSCTIGVMVLAPLENSDEEVYDFSINFLNQKGKEVINVSADHLIEQDTLFKAFPELLEGVLIEKINDVINTGKTIECDYEWQILKGDIKYLHIEIIKLDGSVVFIFQDHTEYKKAEMRLKESQYRFEKAESIAQIGSWEFDTKTNELFWSDELYNILGFKNPLPFPPPPEKREEFLLPDPIKENFRTFDNENHDIKKGTSDEKKITRLDGKEIWVQSDAEKVPDENGDATKIVGYYLDITDRKLKEAEIEKNEKLFRSLFEGAGIGIALVGLDLKLTRVNKKLGDMLGYSIDELVKMTIEELTYPDDLKKDLIHVGRLFKREISSYEIEKRYVTKNGDVFWGLLTVSGVINVNNEVEFLIGMIQDINKKKNSEKQLAENERRFRAIFDSTFQFTGLLEPDGTLIEANETALLFGGFESKDVIGKPFWEANWWKLNKATQLQLQEAVKKAAAGEFTRYAVEVLGKNDSVATIDFSLKPVTDDEGNVVLIIPEGRDITERIKAEKTLSESEARFRLFVSQAPSAIAMLDNNLRYVAVSQKWIEDFKVTDSQIVGKKLFDIFPDLPDQYKKVNSEVLKGKAINKSKDPFTRADGTTIWLKWEAKPWYTTDQAIGGMIVFVQDVTEDVKAEQNILRLNKELEELNQQKTKLLSVIAHDMKSPIANCLGILDVIKINRKDLSKEELLVYLDYLQKASISVNDLIEELLLWARSQFESLSFNPEEVNISDIFQKVHEQYKSAIEKKSLNFYIGSSCSLKLQADVNLLSAVIRNLVSNAIKFSKYGGEIKVKCGIEGSKAVISVIDSGVGIPKENIDKIFDSKINFTTFGTDGEKGTGLGLNLVKNFVNMHGGEISVESEEGKGSTFTILLPIK